MPGDWQTWLRDRPQISGLDSHLNMKGDCRYA